MHSNVAGGSVGGGGGALSPPSSSRVPRGSSPLKIILRP